MEEPASTLTSSPGEEQLESPSGHLISASAQDYARAIFSLTSGNVDPTSTSAVAERLGVTAGSVSTMLKRMDAAGLAEHVPYRGVRLTDAGVKLALRVIRRHRLLEAFLAKSLGIPWEGVDRFADALEHAASDELISRIAAKLGDPTADPHGDPIPTDELVIKPSPHHPTLVDLEPGQRARIVRVSDSNPDMLKFLTEQQIGIGTKVELVSKQPFDGPCELLIERRPHTLGVQVARTVQVEIA